MLIVDEAHLLQVGALQELCLLTNFKTDSFDPFLLILAGQSDLRRTMDFAVMQPFAQRLAMRYHMTGLSQEETAAYIRQQLKLAGAHEPVFAEDAVAAIPEATYGIPRRIGALAEQAMTCAMFADKRTVDADRVLKLKIGGGEGPAPRSGPAPPEAIRTPSRDSPVRRRAVLLRSPGSDPARAGRRGHRGVGPDHPSRPNDPQAGPRLRCSGLPRRSLLPDRCPWGQTTQTGEWYG